MIGYLDLIASKLGEHIDTIHYAPTGSIYIKFCGTTVREIRIGNHNSQKLKRNVWQLRSDAMTHRTPHNRVYNVRDVRKLIAEFH